MTVAPYGSWPSPVSTDLLTSGSVRLSAPYLDGVDLYWLEGHPDQGGRVTLYRRSGDAEPEELTPAPYNIRSRVHEYGGGAYAASSGTIVFAHYVDGRLYRQRPGEEPQPITPDSPYRYGDLRLHLDRGQVLAVREDHTGGGEPVNTIVVLALDGPNHDGGSMVCCGADFYAGPELSADGRLAWTQWNHPDMPWDATMIMTGALVDGRLDDVRQVAGGPEESAIHPHWLPGGDLVYVCDRTDWWNLYRWSDGESRPLLERDAEFALPPWTLGAGPYVVIDDERLVCTWHLGGRSSAGVLSMATGELDVVLEHGASGGIAAADGRAAAVIAATDRPARLAVADLTMSEWIDVRHSSEVDLPSDTVSVARPVSWWSPRGTVHGWYYPPTNADVEAPVDERPPLITWSHGGPTGCATDGFDLEVQYWTSRGLAVLDVNYGGSSGFGRRYRNRLRGGWGIVDVADCAAGALAMVEQGLADPRRLVVQGGSAGGYTTLQALTTTDVFTAGISLYGVGDLEALARDTHKFESRYLDRLIGPYPEAAEVYRQRSPINHVNRLEAPLLLLQGSEDVVVPPEQAETMAAAVRAKGLPVALIIYHGEGHGFRRADSIASALEAELYFLGRVLGFTPADELAAVPIDNLDQPGQ